MKSKLICSLSVIALSVQVQAAVYSTDFESFDGSETGFVAGASNAAFGWSTNDAPDLSPVLNWSPTLDPILGYQAAAIGYYADGYSTLPSQPTVDLSHSFGETLITAGYSAHVDFDYLLSDSTSAQPNRDTFGISLTATGGANIFQLHFTPMVVDAKNVWTVTYTVGGGGSGTLGYLNTNMDPNHMSVSFSGKDASSVYYHVTTPITIGGIPTETTLSGTIPMAPGTMIDKFNMIWNLVDTANPGDNYLLLDNLVIVPEASTSLLLCVAGMSLACRRKRA